MAPLFFKGIKGGNLSCASPGSLAVCTSIDRRSMVRPAIVSRAIERGSSQLQDPRRTKPLKAASKPTSNPRKSTRKSSEYRNGSSITSNKDLISPANSSRYLLTDSAFFDIFPELEPDLDPTDQPSLVPSVEPPRFEGDEPSALIRHHDQQVSAPSIVSVSSPRLLRGCSRGGDASSPSIIRRSSSPRTTTQYRDHDQVWAPSLVPIMREKPSPAILKAASSSSSSNNRTHHDHDQVVVLRVSLHCKGCEGKVRKHVSKMEGVRSFNIDFAAKKVTVMGNVTPLGVLNSVSKVKNAQFWSSSLLSPPRSSASF